MKFIISHDVDHLSAFDHYFKDLILEKLYIRSTLYLVKRKISFKEYLLRGLMPFDKNYGRPINVAKFDIENGVPSTFYFGMDNVKGMSYSQKSAAKYITALQEMGISCGVHGCEYDSLDKIRKEHDDFAKISKKSDFGIRMHYLRRDASTFEKLSNAGYLYDTSEYDKQKGYLIKKPYKIGEMWEFPLTIMEGCLPYKFEEAKKATLKILDEAQKQGLEYVTILFHDYLYRDAFIHRKKWYEWLINYVKDSNKHEFLSYEDAIKELSEK